MKKLGFTLTEALLALAIIGVVAALTLPSVTLEHRKRTYSASLAAAVSDFETAMSTMIVREGVYDLPETRAWRYVDKKTNKRLDKNTNSEKVKKFAEYINFFSEPIGGSLADYYKCDKNPNSIIYSYDKEERELDSNDFIETPFEMKNGILYALLIDLGASNKKDENAMLDNGTNLYRFAANVYIDINGKDKPNTVGRDIFYFILGADGRLYPFGGTDHLNFLGTQISDPNGYGKTARLVKNNYKMDY